jgi:2-polyprenyl-6-methoxyphenol hydroxylase-like FAD-dependent oxidoreductase
MTAGNEVQQLPKTGMPVLVVGAGPTGLVLALWLTKLGIPVRIIDKVAEPGTTSRALAVQARTLELYRQAGIAQTVVDRGVKVAGVNLWVSGARAARVPLRNIGESLTPFSFALIFPQDAHERLLIEQLEARGVRVERPTELVRFDQHSGDVRAILKRPGGAEEACDAAYIAGCDGARSKVRETLGIGFPGGTYSGLFYVADVEAGGPATDGELHAGLDDADLLLVFPMKGAGRVRLVGSVREKQATADHALTFDDVRSRAVDHLKLTITKVNWFSTYRVHHRVANHFRDRRAFLLGDAAHIHSPVGGQGMNTGIGDAVNLAWKLAAVLNGRAAESLLDTYEPERIRFARRLVATTDRAFTVAAARGRIARFIRTVLVPLLIPRLFRLRRTRLFLFRTVSQIGVAYRGSALSEGAAGSVHGGDRLPWVQTSPGTDNFDPLNLHEWQVHVYGEPRRSLTDICGTLRLPIHTFAWSHAFQRAGLARGALYLLRPDGYVALADPACDPERLNRYFSSRGLS